MIRSGWCQYRPWMAIAKGKLMAWVRNPSWEVG
jgi:hypothetical protein